MKNNIMFVLGSLGRGGAERVISILANEYANNGWNVSICMLLNGRVGYDLNDTIELVDMSGNTESRIKRLPFWISSIRKYVKTKHPTVIVSFAARINIISIISCLGLHKKIVVSERNDPKYDGRGIVTSVLTRLLYPRAFAVVFQTKRVMSYFNEKIQKKSIIIPNPIKVTAFVDKVQNEKIVSVGSLKPQKNHLLLLDAFEKVIIKYPQMTLTIYGEGECRKELEAYIKKEHLEKKVFLPGEKANVHEEIKDASMFVLSSDYEGLSNALLEAMMMGIPCISTNCAGSDEYIENEVNGLLTPVGNSDGLASAMIKYIENESLRKQCGMNARKVIDRVGVDNTLYQWHKIID